MITEFKSKLTRSANDDVGHANKGGDLSLRVRAGLTSTNHQPTCKRFTDFCHSNTHPAREIRPGHFPAPRPGGSPPSPGAAPQETPATPPPTRAASPEWLRGCSYPAGGPEHRPSFQGPPWEPKSPEPRGEGPIKTGLELSWSRSNRRPWRGDGRGGDETLFGPSFLTMTSFAG